MAGVLTIRVTSNARDVYRGLNDLVRKQLPFAIAQGINRTALRVAEAEVKNLEDTLDNPSPFTRRSIGIKRARKNDPTAVVFMKDIAASYLQPYEVGGVHKLNSRALLNPKNIRLNQYGQLPRGTLAMLKGRPDIFIGAVKTASGETINGVWQRPTNTARVSLLNARGKRLGKLNKLDASKNNGRGQLKLLIRFGDALPVKKRLNWGARARQIVDRWIDRDMQDALAAAMKTSR
ncbi:hypothetical protein [Burkholderia multivorans]|uniref:hypothetical protein n=1 Tax=Burkholderia multivorans TaxID=87883 RepID=UPI000D00EAA9|nr:hypothetical protein [Burkholderia multivorans]MBN6728546.1 hypothetical protein [Burkholderia multivorans]MBU9489943.1 hypothetical protein [Burkholderia multivorans]MCO8643221.1 hypothetical protein [Burkholderia multivorans]PRE60586.1 hypothetical protein C6P95_25300 [Burkholderia multivorans]PRF16485.1 hypothetical protein C6P96_04985 [Burkholderia multivorans]